VLDTDEFRVPLDGVTMQLRRSELETVASGLSELDASRDTDLAALAEALRRLPTNDRAATWELAVRHFGRRKPVAQAAGEIGLDAIHGQALVERFTDAVSQARASRP
jgi:hypothetical protein